MLRLGYFEPGLISHRWNVQSCDGADGCRARLLQYAHDMAGAGLEGVVGAALGILDDDSRDASLGGVRAMAPALGDAR